MKGAETISLSAIHCSENSQVHSYAAKVDVWHAKVGSYGAHVANGRTRQVYDYFKLNAHVYPLDALSSKTTSQAVLGYI